MKKQPLVMLIAMLATLAGCNSSLHHVSEYPYVEPRQHQEQDFYQHIESLSKQLTNKARFNGQDKVAISTVVNLDNLEDTDGFGRQISEAMFAALTQQGVATLEPRTTGRLQIDPKEGEFSLSRDAEMLRQGLQATYLLVGSYQQTRTGRHVNLRLVELLKQDVVAAAYEFVPSGTGAKQAKVEMVDGKLQRTAQTVSQ